MHSEAFFALAVAYLVSISLGGIASSSVDIEFFCGIFANEA